MSSCTVHISFYSFTKSHICSLNLGHGHIVPTGLVSSEGHAHFLVFDGEPDKVMETSVDSSSAKPTQGAGTDAGCLSQDLIQLFWCILALYLAGQPLAVLPHSVCQDPGRFCVLYD